MGISLLFRFWILTVFPIHYSDNRLPLLRSPAHHLSTLQRLNVLYLNKMVAIDWLTVNMHALGVRLEYIQLR